jgi:parallel beta-helix repeat protein
MNMLQKNIYGRARSGIRPHTQTCIETLEARQLLATFLVTTTSDTGTGSLRDAINKANRTSAADVIQFKIGSGAKTITPGSVLPYVQYPVTIDATTQPGFAGKPLIELRGDKAGTSANGLNIGAGNSTVRGLIINRFNKVGILLVRNGNNKIVGNWIGLTNTGSAAAGNKTKGIVIQSPNNAVGGTSTTDRNVISGNTSLGIQLYTSAAQFNKILGNYIGINVAGTAAVPNTTSGIGIQGGIKNTIGGTTAGARNVISGNLQDGVVVNNPSNDNIITGNYVGLNAAGSSAVGNGWYGIETSSARTLIDRNIVSGNKYSGVVLWLASSNASKVTNNFIGTDKDGKYAVANQWNGVDISSGSSNNLVQNNLISGNWRSGVLSYQGSNNTIDKNILGFAADRKTKLHNGLDGIRMSFTTGIRITGNLIGNNLGNGVFRGSSSTIAVFSGNTIINDALFNVVL